jgi:hypothetical protein
MDFHNIPGSQMFKARFGKSTPCGHGIIIRLACLYHLYEKPHNRLGILGFTDLPRVFI